ncbi:YAK1 [Auxenochlorella protothecoides x Auxenochlorella symbiontica]
MRGRASREAASSPSTRRILTKPYEAVEGKPHDNVNSDLIVAVDDELRSQHTRYVVQDLLGQGTFGQVFRCLEMPDVGSGRGGEVVAVKVIKAQPAYFQQARVEVGILQYLNTKADPGNKHHIVRMKDFFVHHNHLCLVFELLSLNLYEVIRRNKFRGFGLPLVRVLILQILDALEVLHDSEIIHCDLKPENVLLRAGPSGEVKVIDFGSACFQTRTVYSYIQSRFYRSPEVILGCPYTPAIDMWSLGCLAAELFLGLPLFPGACEHDMLTRITSTLGPLPEGLLGAGRNTHKHYDARAGGQGRPDPGGRGGEARPGQGLVLRTPAEFEAANGAPAPVGKTYFKAGGLAEIVGSYPLAPGVGEAEAVRESVSRAAFLDLLRGVLEPDPARRWTPRQAARHPFLTGRDWAGLGAYMPAPDAGPRAAAAPAGAPVGIPVPPRQGSAASGAAPAPPRQATVPGVTGWGARDAGVAPAQQPVGLELSGYHAAALAAALARGGTSAGSLPSLFSPPSRSFAHQARWMEGHGSWRLGDGEAAAALDAPLPSSYSGLLPLLPGGSVHLPGFQPSSVSSYAAALAQAQAAAYESQAAAAYEVQAQLAAAQQAYMAAAGGYPGSYPGGTSYPGAGAGAFPQAQAAQQHLLLQQYSAQQALVAAQQQQQQQQLAAAQHAQAAAQAQAQGVPQAGWQSAAMPTAVLHGAPSGSLGPGMPSPGFEDGPEPGDWNPLWSDDVLREEDAAPRPLLSPPSSSSALGGSLSQRLSHPPASPSAPSAGPPEAAAGGWWRQRAHGTSLPPPGPHSLGASRRSREAGGGSAHPGPRHQAEAQAYTPAHAPDWAAACAQIQAAAAAAQGHGHGADPREWPAAPAGLASPASSLPTTLGGLNLAGRSMDGQGYEAGTSVPGFGFQPAADGSRSSWQGAQQGVGSVPGVQAWIEARTQQQLQPSPFLYQAGYGGG